MPNRALTHLAVGAVVALPTLGLAAPALAVDRAPSAPVEASESSPPPGTAEANALLLDPLLAIAHTKATAAGGSGSATGNAVEVGGEPLIDGKTGGSQQGAGSKQGSLLDTGVTPLGQLQVTPWSATVTGSGGSSTADGDAALLRLFLVDPTLLKVALLQSHSHAQSDGTTSSSSSSSDGAVVEAGDGALSVHVLHAESSSSGGGKSYLVDINGNQVGSSDDANGSCTLEVPDVVALSCLSATGGQSGTTSQAGASVGDATLGSGELTGTVVGTKATGTSTQGSGTTTPPTSSGSTSSDASGALPFTGSSLPPLAALGMFAVAAGAWLHQASRRFRLSPR
jgi:hypothetical protein